MILYMYNTGEEKWDICVLFVLYLILYLYNTGGGEVGQLTAAPVSAVALTAVRSSSKREVVFTMLRTQAVFVLQETNNAFVFAHGDFLTSLDKCSISRHFVLVQNFQFCTFRGQCADTDTMTHSTVPIKPTDDRFLWHHWQMEEQLLFELLFTKKNSLLNLIFWDMSYCGIAHFVSLGGLQTRDGHADVDPCGSCG